MGAKLWTLIGLLIFLPAALITDALVNGHLDEGRMQDEAVERVTDDPEIRSLENLDVRVEQRTVHASGLVDTKEERARVTSAILEVPGILTVVNDVRVDRLLETLLQRLKDQIAADPTEGEFDYRVSPDGHTVTLDGWVPKGEEDLKQAIEDTVAEVPGVRRVINNLNLGRPVDTTLRERLIDILSVNPVYFDYNKATIRRQSMPGLREVASVLVEEFPEARVQIEGHTDSIASEAYNQDLSERRANAVKDALVELGVEPDRLDAIGYGELQPIAPNTTPEGRADNRRIDFEILTEGVDAGGDSDSEAGTAGDR